MAASDDFRRRIAAAGAAIPDDLVEIVSAMAGPMLTAHEALTALDLGDAEPFSPGARLVADAA